MAATRSGSIIEGLILVNGLGPDPIVSFCHIAEACCHSCVSFLGRKSSCHFPSCCCYCCYRCQSYVTFWRWSIDGRCNWCCHCRWGPGFSNTGSNISIRCGVRLRSSSFLISPVAVAIGGIVVITSRLMNARAPLPIVVWFAPKLQVLPRPPWQATKSGQRKMGGRKFLKSAVLPNPSTSGSPKCSSLQQCTALPRRCSPQGGADKLPSEGDRKSFICSPRKNSYAPLHLLRQRSNSVSCACTCVHSGGWIYILGTNSQNPTG